MSEEMNILAGGVEVLNEMKASLLKLDELKVRSTELQQKQEQLEKDIALKKKALDTELSSTLSKRKAELEATYDSQLDQTRDRIKKTKAKRDKLKTSKVGERITQETADKQEQIRSLKQDLKGIYQRNHISGLFRNSYFFSLYFPNGIGDFLVILLTVIIVLALPAGIYFLLPEQVRRPLVAVALYVGILGLALLIFTLIFKNVRNRKKDSLTAADEIRGQIRDIRRQIKKQESSIRRDKDESNYGLEKFDEELAALDAQVDEIINEKKQALKDFEGQTKTDITSEITDRYSADLEQLKSANDAAYDEQNRAADEIKSMSLEMSRKYEAYVGKDNLSVPVIESLIDIIENQDAANIADALAYYKKMTSESKKE